MNHLVSGIQAEAIKLFGGVAATVGQTAAKAAASNPVVQSALGDIEARLVLLFAAV